MFTLADTPTQNQEIYSREPRAAVLLYGTAELISAQYYLLP